MPQNKYILKKNSLGVNFLYLLYKKINFLNTDYIKFIKNVI